MHPRGVNPPTVSRYYARRPSDPADEPLSLPCRPRHGGNRILQEGFAVTLDYAIAGAVSMDNRHRGVGLTGEGERNFTPPHPARRVTGSVFRRTPPAASILMGEAVCDDADPPVLPSPPEVHQTRAQP